MKRTCRVLVQLLRLQLSSSMAYRLSFWGATMADGTMFMLQLVVFSAIARQGGVGDWTGDHLKVFVGSFLALNGLEMATYFFGIISLPDQIRTGALDLALVKPVHPLLYVAFGHPNLGSAAMAPMGWGLVVWGSARLGFLTPGHIVAYLAAFLLMAVLLFALMLLTRSLAFWLTRVGALDDLEGVLVDSSFRLPAPAIQGGMKLLLYVILPYGLLANLQAEAVFGGLTPGGWLLAVAVTASALTLSLRLWKRGLARYDSANS